MRSLWQFGASDFKASCHSQLLHLVSLASSVRTPLKFNYLGVQSHDLIVQMAHLRHLQDETGTCNHKDQIWETMSHFLCFSRFINHASPVQRQQLFPRSPARLSASSQRLWTKQTAHQIKHCAQWDIYTHMWNVPTWTCSPSEGQVWKQTAASQNSHMP